MHYILSYTVLAIIVLCFLSLYKKPNVVLGLIFGMYAAEQMLMRGVVVFSMNPQFYNYIIGGMSVMAIIMSVIKHGMPRINNDNAIIFFLFFMLSWASVIWTNAPESAVYAMKHFTFEGLLGFVLPFFVIRKVKDLNLVILIIAVYGVLVSMSLLLIPVAGAGGRVLLIEGGTVLSPASMLGTAMIFIAAIDDKVLSYSSKFKYVVLLLLAVGIFISGARTQFFVGVILSGLILLSSKSPIKTLLTAAVGFLLALQILVFVFPDLIDGQISSSSSRYISADEFKDGFEFRLQSILESFTLDSLLVGHGLMGWAYMKFGQDVYMYPHNSIAQVYYELGLVGLTLFLVIIYKSYSMGYAAYKNFLGDKVSRKMSLALLAYLTFSFLMSLKQGTFLSCTGVYIAFGCITVFYNISNDRNKIESKPNDENSDKCDELSARYPVLK